VDPNQDQLVRYAPFDLRRPHGTRHGWRALRARHEHASDRVGVAERGPSDDIDPDEVTKVFLHAAVFLGFMLVIAVGAVAMFIFSTLRHWLAALT
jgi:hypothetical protein